MTEIGIFFGSSSGATQIVARRIQRAFGDGARIHEVRRAKAEDLLRYDFLVLGSPTYEKGKLQETWYPFLEKMRGVDLGGKRVAVFALGDQKKYEKSFAEALAPLAEQARACGATLIGAWPSEGYRFKRSRALDESGERFLGLVIDADRQPVLTMERVERWVTQLKRELDGAETASAGAD